MRTLINQLTFGNSIDRIVLHMLKLRALSSSTMFETLQIHTNFVTLSPETPFPSSTSSHQCKRNTLQHLQIGKPAPSAPSPCFQYWAFFRSEHRRVQGISKLHITINRNFEVREKTKSLPLMKSDKMHRWLCFWGGNSDIIFFLLAGKEIKSIFTWGQQRIVYASWTRSQNRWLSRKNKGAKAKYSSHKSKCATFVRPSLPYATWHGEGWHYLPAISDGWWSESRRDLNRNATSACPRCGRTAWISSKINETAWLCLSPVSASKQRKAQYLPVSKALVVPFRTSSVRAATMSACLAMALALSTASHPSEVIICVPLMRARPFKERTDVNQVHMLRSFPISVMILFLT